MKATDFSFEEDLKFDPERGITSFHADRMTIFNASSMGILRHNIVEALRIEKARSLFIKFGYQHGYFDCMQMKVNYDFDSEQELLAAGPLMHTWEGLVKVVPGELEFDREKGIFVFEGVWKNSWEAEQHLSYYEEGDEAVCWSLAGYASGYGSAFFGSKVVAVETACKGKGDDECAWKIKVPSEWGEEAKPYIAALEEF